jgi:glyoxylase-like metal-dependent hydrolase (beta-lactamase superfamily II)
MEPTGRLKLSIAGYDLFAIPTGEFGLDGGAMFGTVPKVLWEKSNPPDAQNRIKMEARGLLLKGHGKIILIDCGNGSDFIAKYGEKLGTKFQEMYNVQSGGTSLINSLKSIGVSTDQVTDVVLTHLHFDHAGGGTTEKNGKLVPTFEKAQYYLQKANLETASQPNLREKASYFESNYKPLLDSGKLKLLNGDTENILPNISVQVSNGHTQGHQFVVISDAQSGLVYCGDVIPTSSHVRLAWVMGYDLNPLMLIQEKQKLLTQATAKNWYLFFEHDPYCDIASVTAKGSDFAVEARYSLG